MRKRDIVLKISEDTGIKQIIVKDVVQRTFDVIIKALKDGKRIELRNFGVFSIKQCRARVGRNPKTGEEVPIPKRVKVSFKPGLKMDEIK